jgi:hypothetical protein
MSSKFSLPYKGEKHVITVDSVKIKNELLARGCYLNPVGNYLYVRLCDDRSYATHCIADLPVSEGRITFKNKNPLDLRQKNYRLHNK